MPALAGGALQDDAGGHAREETSEAPGDYRPTAAGCRGEPREGRAGPAIAGLFRLKGLPIARARDVTSNPGDNPFAIGTVVKGDEFADRDAELRLLEDESPAGVVSSSSRIDGTCDRSSLCRKRRAKGGPACPSGGPPVTSPRSHAAIESGMTRRVRDRPRTPASARPASPAENHRAPCPAPPGGAGKADSASMVAW